jgi:hypothetical protein
MKSFESFFGMKPFEAFSTFVMLGPVGLLVYARIGLDMTSESIRRLKKVL